MGLLLVVGIASAFAGGNGAREYAVKAAFLFNFTKFIDWPAEAFQDDAAPFVIGVYGANPFDDELVKAVRGRKVAGRDVAVRFCRNASDAADTHLVFFAVEDGATWDALRRLDGRPIVTVGQSEAFLRRGGAIAFQFQEDRLRFAINMAAAETAGVRVSAQLQKLATSVQR